MATSYLRRREQEEVIVQEWVTYAKKYRELISTYNELLDQKRKLGIRLRKVKSATIKDLPKIDIFNCTTIDEVEDYLLDLNNEQVYCLMVAIDHCVHGYVFVTISNRIDEYRYEIKRHGSHRSTLGYDPDYCKSAGRKPKVSTSGTNFSESQ